MSEPMRKPQVKGPSLTNKAGGGGNRFSPKARAINPKRTLARVIQIYLKWAKTIILALLFTLVSALFSVAIPYYVGQCFNAFDIPKRLVNYSILWFNLKIIFSLYLMSWLLSFSSGVLMLRTSQKLVYVLRRDLFDKMQRLPLKFFDTRAHGDTMSRMTNDVDNISSTIAQTTTQLLASSLTLVGSLVVMLKLNVSLTLAVLVCVPLVFTLTRTIAKRSRAYFLAQQRQLGQLNGIIEESVSGLKLVKAFEREEQTIHQFKQVNQQLAQSSTNAQVWSGYMMPLLNVINNLVFALVAITGGILSIHSGLSVGVIVSFMTYAKQFTQPLNAIAGMFNNIQSALAGAERVFEVMDAEEEVADDEEATDMTVTTGTVKFERVSFGYREDQMVLKAVSFEVDAGETVALVGETGAGKTTIVNLITRFYDPQEGQIYIDGQNIKKVKRSSLRQCFSVVLQDTNLFNGTILDNIRYAKPTASREAVIEAAKVARAHHFISKLPNGYETKVFATSDSLSQGQRQLIAIARAVLSNAPILILDEATSSVDTKTEKEIQQALVHLMKHRTSFLVAHRLSTIRDADKILVIGEGSILESGNHETLMKQKGRYFEMVTEMTKHEADSSAAEA